MFQAIVWWIAFTFAFPSFAPNFCCISIVHPEFSLWKLCFKLLCGNQFLNRKSEFTIVFADYCEQISDMPRVIESSRKRSYVLPLAWVVQQKLGVNDGNANVKAIHHKTHFYQHHISLGIEGDHFVGFRSTACVKDLAKKRMWTRCFRAYFPARASDSWKNPKASPGRFHQSSNN